MMTKAIIRLVGFMCALSLLSAAQTKPKINTEYKYLLLATVKTSTMQKEMDEAAALGYRVIVGSPHRRKRDGAAAGTPAGQRETISIQTAGHLQDKHHGKRAQ
jgi:hypothetical protein